eukprot:TRINITY_DN536_c0_g2_i1.p1 TRINITY_DN536_c0_g2~~TRINITY_DN536_c0_g2_i1.p1  ORF type:complete len:853 (+),score=268.28 TRINITY_DN536_c0_g2_i1:74-2560(+)
MPPKSKKEAEEAADAESAAKKAKTETPAKEEGAEDEVEVDDKKDARAKLKEIVGFDGVDSTLNVMPTMGGKLLTALSEGGMQHLIAGARANAAIKSGRYLYEVQILEGMGTGSSPSMPSRAHVGPVAKPLLRVGFSTQSSSLILGHDDIGICFDSDGSCYLKGDGPVDRKRWTAAKTGLPAIGRNVIVGVLLNADSKSPNADTVSLFLNGKRAAPPFQLPSGLKGMKLYPHIAFRNVSVQVHFGPEPLLPLPFKCRSLQDAAAADVQMRKAVVTRNGKFDVLFPVGFPNEGTFEWVDNFLEQNPDYVELSDRKIVEWVQRSGLTVKPKNSKTSSRDRPELGCGVAVLDDWSARGLQYTIAGCVPRKYLVVEVKENLVPEDRRKLLQKFPKSRFKRIAHVLMGEPTDSYKQLVKDKLLKDKQAKAKSDLQQRKEAAKKKQLIEQKKKEALKAQKKEEKSEVKEEDKEVKEEEEEKANEDGEPEVTLTEEEEAKWFYTADVPDVSESVVDKSFASFALPEAEEGFDELEYEWQGADDATAYARKWVLEKKRSAKMEDLVPGEWFRTRITEWMKAMIEWQAKQAATPKAKRDSFAGDEDMEIRSVTNVNNIGNGVPLYASFSPEDFALMALRWELHTLVKAFEQDVKDPDRNRVPEAHFGYYYVKYYKKMFAPKNFGKEALAEVLRMVADTVKLDEEGMLVSKLTEEESKSINIFVMLTEEARRERQRRLDAGDESARLKFNIAALKQGLGSALVAPKAPLTGMTPLTGKAPVAAKAPLAQPTKPQPKVQPKQQQQPPLAAPAALSGKKAVWKPGPALVAAKAAAKAGGNP